MGRLHAGTFLRRRLMGAALASCGWLRREVGVEIGRALFRPVHKAFGSRLRLMLSAGSALSPRVQADFMDLGFRLAQAYGLTETSGAASVTPLDAIVEGSVGVPMEGTTLRIRKPDADGVGEIWIRGPIVTSGYHERPEETRAALQDGWLLSGDLGRIGASGNLYITGRCKEVIVLDSGKNIYPEELEDHYAAQPSVKEVCVLAQRRRVGDEELQRLHAVVVPDWERLAAEGVTSVRERVHFELQSASLDLPSYQRVLSFELRREPLPRTATRKVQRFLVHAELDTAATTEADATTDNPEAADRLRSPVGRTVCAVLRRRLGEEVVILARSHLELDLGLDSLNRMEALLAVEAALGISVSDEEAAALATVDDLIRLCANRSGADAATAPGRETSWDRLLQAAGPEHLPEQLRRPRSLLNRTLLWAMLRTTHLLARVFLRLRMLGVEHLPERGPVLVCPNHTSFLDGFVVCSSLPWRLLRHAFVLGEHDYISSGVAAILARFVGLVPTDPNLHLRHSMQVCAAGLKDGRTLILFPEGTRSVDGRLQPLKQGAPILATELGVPIVPAVLEGTYQAWPRGAPRPKPGRVSLRFGPAIHPRDAVAGANSPEHAYSVVSAALQRALLELGAPGD
jgi:long-chain acyl-CoA synthetase